MLDRVEIKQLYDRISVLYNKPKLTVEQLKEYETLYEIYTYQELNSALNVYAKEKHFQPTPAQLLKIVDEARIVRRNKAIAAKRDSNGELIYDCWYCLDGGLVLVDQSHLGKDVIGVKCHCRYDFPEMELQKRMNTGYVFDRNCWHKPRQEPELWVGDTLEVSGEYANSIGDLRGALVESITKPQQDLFRLRSG